MLESEQMRGPRADHLAPPLDGEVLRLVKTPAKATALAPVGNDAPRLRTSDRVHEELVAAIRDLRLLPGARLSEADLAQQLGVSRTPLREAIARLADDRLVTVVPQVGTRVALIGLRDVEQARFVREHLEVGAFTVAAHLPVRDLARMRALLVEQEQALECHDVEAFFVADEHFHQEIFEVSGYVGVWRAMQPMKLQLDRLRRLSLPNPATVRELIDEHTAIVDALEAGDVRRGERVLRKHARRVSKYGPGLRARHPELFAD